MGKALNALLLVFTLDFLLYYFYGQTGITALTLWLIQPYNWDALPIFGSFYAVLGAAGVAGAFTVVTGLYFIRNEWIIYASLALVTLSFGSVLFRVWQIIADGTSMFGAGSEVIATLMCAPLLVYYAWNMLDYARGRDF